MAIGDELDKLLADDRLNREDWESLEKILGIAFPTESHERRTIASKEIRHNYGHTAANLFREWYEPDYAELVRATANKLSIRAEDNLSINNIENLILAEMVDLAKKHIVQEHGQLAWDEIEKQVQQEIDQLVASQYSKQGFLLPDDIENLERARELGALTLLMKGQLAGRALYVVLNQTLNSIAILVLPALGAAISVRALGVGVLGVLAPIFWPFLFISDLGNTNWKKTIPAIVIIALFRRKLGLA